MRLREQCLVIESKKEGTMLRRFIEWLLHILRIKVKESKSAIESIKDLLPVLFAATICLSISRVMHTYVKLSWYRLLWWKIRYYVRRARAVVIGY